MVAVAHGNEQTVELVGHPVGERSLTVAFGGQLSDCVVGGCAETDHGWHVLHASAPRSLLIATYQEWVQTESTSHQQGASPGWPAELVARDGHEVGAELGELDRKPSGGLGRVDVHQHAAFPARSYDLCDGAERPDLVVAPLDVDERRVVADGGQQVVSVDAAGSVHADHGVRTALGPLAHRRVLHGGQHDVVPVGTGARPEGRGGDRGGE
jgi:hypothetical protein